MTDWKKLMVTELSRALNDEHDFTHIWDYLLEIKDFIEVASVELYLFSANHHGFNVVFDLDCDYFSVYIGKHDKDNLHKTNDFLYHFDYKSGFQSFSSKVFKQQCVDKEPSLLLSSLDQAWKAFGYHKD